MNLVVVAIVTCDICIKALKAQGLESVDFLLGLLLFLTEILNNTRVRIEEHDALLRGGEALVQYACLREGPAPCAPLPRVTERVSANTDALSR